MNNSDINKVVSNIFESDSSIKLVAIVDVTTLIQLINQSQNPLGSLGRPLNQSVQGNQTITPFKWT